MVWRRLALLTLLLLFRILRFTRTSLCSQRAVLLNGLQSVNHFQLLLQSLLHCRLLLLLLVRSLQQPQLLHEGGRLRLRRPQLRQARQQLRQVAAQGRPAEEAAHAQHAYGGQRLQVSARAYSKGPLVGN